MAVARAIYAECTRLQVTSRVLLGTFMCALVESGVKTGEAVRYKDHDSVGPFQQRMSIYGGNLAELEDPATSCRYFVVGYPPGGKKGLNDYAPTWTGTTGSMVQKVQGSAYPDRYDRKEADARALIAQLSSGAAPAGGPGGGFVTPTVPTAPAGPNLPTVDLPEQVRGTRPFLPTSIRVFAADGSGLADVEVLSTGLKRSITDASTLTVALSDPLWYDDERAFLQQPLAQTRSLVEVDGLVFALTDVSKQGAQGRTLTFTDAVAVALMDSRGVGPAGEAGTELGAYLRTLVEASAPGVRHEVETGDRLLKAVQRGDPESDPLESTWEATKRLCDQRNWRRFVSEGVFYAGSDEFLMARRPPIPVREFHDGVGAVDFAYSTLVTAETTTFVVESTPWRAPPGTAVSVLSPIGVGKGNFLVESTELTGGSTAVTVGITRTRPELPAPADTGPTGLGVTPAEQAPGSGEGVFGETSSYGYQWPQVNNLGWVSEYNTCRGNGCSRRHKGIDIGGTVGTPIYAMKDGVVVQVKDQAGEGGDGYGRVVQIDHDDGFRTVYAHNAVNRVTRGQTVRRGDHVADVGHSGNASPEDPHVHTEIRHDKTYDNAKDPRIYLPPGPPK